MTRVLIVDDDPMVCAAIEIYLEAHSIFPNSALLSNIGAEYQQSGMPKEALK